jgi:protein-disulfide isomerase
MLKQAAVMLLLLAIIGQTFNRAVLVTSYYANTEAYAKNCENKAKPKMHCNGKCQMMKKMQQEENKDKQNPERRNNADEVLSSKSFFLSLQVYSPVTINEYADFYSAKPKDLSTEFFHPPGA